MDHRVSAFFLFVLSCSVLHAQEICNNALDDDGDGAIDLNDPDCLCSGTLNDGLTSLIANGSFEDQTCCPMGFVSLFSPPWLSCATGWSQGTQGTTDYFHSCGYTPDAVVVEPAPDGYGFTGVYAITGTGADGSSSGPYYEYLAGHPLGNLSVEAGLDLTFQMWVAPTWTDGMHTRSTQHTVDEPYRLAILGHVGPDVMLPATTYGCLGAADNWVELAVFDIRPSTSWQPIQARFIAPATINVFAVGGPCDLPGYQAHSDVPLGDDTVSFSPYFLMDDLILAPSSEFSQGITQVGSLCTEDLGLTATLPIGATDGQWYRDGIALVGRTSAMLDLSGAEHDGGVYTFTATGSSDCIRMDHTIARRPSFTATPTTGPAPLTVTFVATSTNGNPSWAFGDGTTAVGDTVVHTFTDAGLFSVSLEHEGDGCDLLTTMVDAIAVTDIGAGLGEAFDMVSYLVVPNPVQGLLHAAPGKGFTNWSILNALGQEVLRGGVVGGVISTAPPASSGTYVLRAEGEGRMAFARFIVP